MVRTAFSSISCCKRSTAGSVAITSLARSESRPASASMESAICFSAKPPISATRRVISCRSTSKALAVCSLIIAVIFASSAEPAGDVILRAPVARRSENPARRVELHEIAEIHESREVGHTSRLLHIVRHDRDRVVDLELVDQFFDLGGGDRIERRARFVEQDNLGLDRYRACDAQPLLLAAGEAQSIGGE